VGLQSEHTGPNAGGYSSAKTGISCGLLCHLAGVGEGAGVHAAGGDLADAQVRQTRLRVDHVPDQLVALPRAVAAVDETTLVLESCLWMQ